MYKENLNDIDIFFNDTIHKILILICASYNDHYILSKINFFKDNKKDLKKLKKQTENFNKIITYHKKNKFNFEKFFIELQPKNLESEGLFKMDEFIEYLEENYDIIIELNNKYYCSYDIFAKMIIKLDSNISHKLIDLKTIYLETMCIMINSQKEIIKYINESNNKKRNLPEFLGTIFKIHLD